MTDGDGAPGRPARRLHKGFAIAAFAFAFLITVTYARQAQTRDAAAIRRAQLAELVIERQRRAADLQDELVRLRARAEALGERGPAAALRREIDALAAYAGTTPVRGPGVRVVLADSPLAEDEGSQDFQIQDVDVQLVVNELWSSGAEAVSANGQRIVSTSAIRSAGGSILVNYKVLTSPYQIDAIGNGEAMQRRFHNSPVAARFRTWAKVYRLSLSIKTSDRLSLPAFTGSVRLTHAEPG